MIPFLLTFKLYSWNLAFQKSRKACGAKWPSHFQPQLLRAHFWRQLLLSVSCESFQRCLLPGGALCVYASVYSPPQPPTPALTQRTACCIHSSGEGWDCSQEKNCKQLYYENKFVEKNFYLGKFVFFFFFFKISFCSCFNWHSTNHKFKQHTFLFTTKPIETATKGNLKKKKKNTNLPR